MGSDSAPKHGLKRRQLFALLVFITLLALFFLVKIVS
jgi:hypothetical protein